MLNEPVYLSRFLPQHDLRLLMTQKGDAQIGHRLFCCGADKLGQSVSASPLMDEQWQVIPTSTSDRRSSTRKNVVGGLSRVSEEPCLGNDVLPICRARGMSRNNQLDSSES